MNILLRLFRDLHFFTITRLIFNWGLHQSRRESMCIFSAVGAPHVGFIRHVSVYLNSSNITSLKIPSTACTMNNDDIQITTKKEQKKGNIRYGFITDENCRQALKIFIWNTAKERAAMGSYIVIFRQAYKDSVVRSFFASVATSSLFLSLVTGITRPSSPLDINHKWTKKTLKLHVLGFIT